MSKNGSGKKVKTSLVPIKPSRRNRKQKAQEPVSSSEEETEEETEESQTTQSETESEGGDEESPKTSKDDKKKNTNRDNEEANVEWNYVVFVASKRFKASDLVKKGSDPCRITFTQDDGSLRLEKTNKNADFQKLEYNKKTRFTKGNHDLVQSIDLLKFSTNVVDQEFKIVATGVPKFMNEGFIDGSPTVAHVVVPYTLEKNTCTDIEILRRKIPNSVIEFQNEYPGRSIENLDHDTTTVGELTYIHKNSPVVTSINDARAEKGKKPLPISAEMTDQVIVKTAEKKKFEKKTRSLMKHAIPYANVTNGFELAFVATTPWERLDEQEKYRKNQKEGRPFLGWAEGLAASNNDKEADEEKYIQFNFKCRVGYLAITDEKIPIKY